MIIKNYTDTELKDMIIQLANKNGIEEMYESSPSEMADYFLSYTTLGRQIILDWYSGLERTKGKMNFIQKKGFERKYFYIGGIDAAVALMLLGYKVDSHRYANVTKKSMESLNQFGHDNSDGNYSFFEKYNLSSKDINKNWSDSVRENL